MKVAPLLFGSSLVVLSCSQTVGRIRTTYINGDHSLAGPATLLQQPIAVAQPFQQYLHSTTLPAYTQSLHPIQVHQSVAPISHIQNHGLFLAPRAASIALPISQRAAVSQPVVQQQLHQGQTQAFAFQTDPFNQIRLLHQDVPPHFEQIAIKDPKVDVFDVRKPAAPPMRILQVRRAADPPATIEFVNEGTQETQVTVLDDTDDAVQVEEAREEESRVIEPRQRLLPPAVRLSRKISISPPKRRVLRNNY